MSENYLKECGEGVQCGGRIGTTGGGDVPFSPWDSASSSAEGVGTDPDPPQTDPPGCCWSGRGDDFELVFPLIFQTDALGRTPNALIQLYSVRLGSLSKKTYLKNICLHRIT